MTTEVRVDAACAVYPHDLLRRALDRRHQLRQKFVIESQERFDCFDGFDDEVSRGKRAVGSHGADRASFEDDAQVCLHPDAELVLGAAWSRK